MAQTYSLVKKESQAHQEALTSRFIQNRDIFAVGDSHVLIPQPPAVEFGHNVSHAKNRTSRQFRPNMQTLSLDVDGEKKSIRVSGRDMRTYKKIMASYVRE